MKNTIKNIALTGSILSLSSVAFAGDYMVPGDNAVAVRGDEDSIGKKMLRTPGRVLNVGDGMLPMLSEGTQEFGVSGNVNYADDVAYNLNLSYGWFIKDRWEFGFNAGVQGVESDINFSVGLFTEYNWLIENSKWVPFVGFSTNWAKLDSGAFDADSIALGLDVGVKYFIRENIALSFSIGADYAFDDVFPGGDDFAKQINIGTRFYF
ncbi:MAG: hypothetical protein ACSHYF_08525 [Verrucomicrobiaceae bacterium]